MNTETIRHRADRKLKPIPLWMTLRGYLPRAIGGMPVYEAVVYYRWFDSDKDLLEYLAQQLAVAIVWRRHHHMKAIAKLIEQV